MTRWRAALGAILLLAAWLRLDHLAAEGLWADEAFVVALSSLDLGALLHRAIAADTHPPLHALILHGWIRLFGNSEIAVRSLSVLFGVAGVAYIARLGSRLLGPEAGLHAATLLAVSPYHVYYSQETRGYAVLVFLAIASWDGLAILLGEDEASGRDEPRRVAVYALPTVFMLYTHPYALFILFAQGLYVFGGQHAAAARRRFLGALLAVAVLFAPWMPILVAQAVRTQRSFWIERPGPSSLLATFVQYAGSRPAAIATGLLITVAVVQAARAHALRRTAGLLGLWLTVPHVVPFLISQLAQPIYLTRAGIGSLAALPLLSVMPLRSTSRVVARTVVAALTVLSLVSLWQYRAVGARDQWREAAAYVGARASASDLVVLDDAYGAYPFDYYRRPDLTTHPLRADAARPEGAADLQRVVDGRSRVWLLRYLRPPDHEAVRLAIGDGWRLVDYQAWRGVLLYRFDRR